MGRLYYDDIEALVRQLCFEGTTDEGLFAGDIAGFINAAYQALYVDIVETSPSYFERASGALQLTADGLNYGGTVLDALGVYLVTGLELQDAAGNWIPLDPVDRREVGLRQGPAATVNGNGWSFAGWYMQNFKVYLYPNPGQAQTARVLYVPELEELGPAELQVYVVCDEIATISAGTVLLVGGTRFTVKEDAGPFPLVPFWQANFAYPIGALAFLSEAGGGRGFILRCSTAGTTGIGWEGGILALGDHVTGDGPEWDVVGSGNGHAGVITVTVQGEAAPRGTISIEDPGNPWPASPSSLYNLDAGEPAAYPFGGNLASFHRLIAYEAALLALDKDHLPRTLRTSATAMRNQLLRHVRRTQLQKPRRVKRVDWDEF